ncbi:MAG: hypothetical protein GY737_06585 [Desulfobacteraceae bacterium]|nr:hypothetical protein [Desulfobacteraceae bacterium]
MKTPGFRPNFCDYTDKKVELINNTGTIYRPTAFHVQTASGDLKAPE